jgi:hypothetical protein
MAFSPGTKVLTKAALKSYQDLDDPSLMDGAQQTSADLGLPAPVDPRGQVPVPWRVNLITSKDSLRTVIRKVPHSSRSKFRTVVTRRPAHTIRAPRSRVRAIPLSREETPRIISAHSAPAAALGAPSDASALEHAPNGSSLLHATPQVGSAPQSLPHWTPAPELPRAPPQWGAPNHALLPSELSITPQPSAWNMAGMHPSLPNFGSIPQQNLPAASTSGFTGFSGTPESQMAQLGLSLPQTQNDIRRTVEMILGSLNAPPPQLPAMASQATIIDFTSPTLTTSVPTVTPVPLNIVNSQPTVIDFEALPSLQGPFPNQLDLSAPGIHVAPQAPPAQARRPMPDSLDQPPAKRTALDGSRSGSPPPYSTISGETSSLLATGRKPFQFAVPTTQPLPSVADLQYSALHQQAYPTGWVPAPSAPAPLAQTAPAAGPTPDPNFLASYTIPRLSANTGPQETLNRLLRRDDESALRPDDSVSQYGSNPSARSQESVNPMNNFRGLEGTFLTGTFAAMPKPSQGLVPSHVADALWYHMRGFGTSSDKWPRADQIAKQFTSEAATAFRPPPTPLELPLPGLAAQRADEALMRRQRTYSAPAHIVAALMGDMDSSAIIPLREALASTVDTRARQRIEQTIEFLQGHAAMQLGYALRSLAASYNFLATDRKEALLKLQSAEIQRALQHEKLGFRRFFEREVGPLTQLAATSAQLRLTQAALSRIPTGKPRGQSNQNRGQNNNNNNRNNNKQQNNNQNQNARGGRGSGGGRRRGGRGRGRGRGGSNQSGSKPNDKE